MCAQKDVDPTKVEKIGRLIIAIISAIIGFFTNSAVNFLSNL